MTVTTTAPATKKYPAALAGHQAREWDDLQTDEDERQDVQRENGRLPHCIRRDAHPCRNAGRRRPRHRRGIADHRQDRRQAEMLRQQPDAEGRDELQDDRLSGRA